jgi:glutathione synthase
MRVLIIMDPIDKIDPERDTTLVLVEELFRRHHAIDLCQSEGLEIERGEATAMVSTVVEVERRVFPSIGLDRAQWRWLRDYDLILLGERSLNDLDPGSRDLLFDAVRRHGTLLLNDPRHLATGRERLATLLFPTLAPPTRVTRSPARIADFMELHDGHVRLRPLAGTGAGDEVELRSDDPGRRALLHLLTLGGARPVLVQPALPRDADEKRIVLLDGRPLGALVERRRGRESVIWLRSTGLDSRDVEICATVGPCLRTCGVPLASIAIVRGWLTGIDTTCGYDVQTINRLDGVHLEQQIVDWVEERVAPKRRRAWAPRRVSSGHSGTALAQVARPLAQLRPRIS